MSRFFKSVKNIRFYTQSIRSKTGGEMIYEKLLENNVKH